MQARTYVTCLKLMTPETWWLFELVRLSGRLACGDGVGVRFRLRVDPLQCVFPASSIRAIPVGNRKHSVRSGRRGVGKKGLAMSRQTKRITSIAFTGAAAAITLGAVTPQAHASGEWHIKAGGLPYHGAVAGTINGAVVIKDVKTGTTITCARGTLTGNIPVSNVGSPGIRVIGTVSGLSMKTCAVDTIYKVNVNKRPMTPKIALRVQSYAAPVTKGFFGSSASVPPINLGIAGISPNCSGTVLGNSLPLSYNNTNNVLTLNKARKVTMRIVGGPAAPLCPLFRSGDTAYISGKYTISLPTKLTISLP